MWRLAGVSQNGHAKARLWLRLSFPVTTLFNMRKFCLLFVAIVLIGTAFGAQKQHVVSFGKTMQVKLFLGPSEDRTTPMQVRPLYVDSNLKEFVTGSTHDITDRLLVVRRAFRINDSLPDEPKTLPKWMWQRGGWLLVDRTTGRITPLNLPEFDPFYSEAEWYRDYVAYCGINDTGEKLSAMVFQLGRKKPLLKKDLGAATNGDNPDSECAAPQWDRKPPRVTFKPKNTQGFTFTLPGRTVDMAPSPDEAPTEQR